MTLFGKEIFWANESVLYEGYSINYSHYFQQKINMHNHQRTQIIQNADYEFLLTIDVINQNPFKKAQIKIEFIDLKYHPADPKSSIMLIFDKKCFGISCSVKDFAQLIKKSFDHQHFTQVLKKI